MFNITMEDINKNVKAGEVKIEKPFVRIKLYVPFAGSDRVTAGEYLKNIRELLTTTFGGCSIYDVDGCYMGLKGLEREYTLCYEVITNKEYNNYIAWIAHAIKDDLKQETVLFTVEKLEEVCFI